MAIIRQKIAYLCSSCGDVPCHGGIGIGVDRTTPLPAVEMVPLVTQQRVIRRIVILIDVKTVVYVGRTRQRPKLSDIQKRLGVRLLMVDLEKGICEFKETEFEEEDAEQTSGDDDYY